MAILVPTEPKACTFTEAEVYRRLGAELPDDWVMLHSLGLPGHEKKIRGESDIVVISAAGIFVLEVKGGKVRCQDGVWIFGEGSKSYRKKEDPWTQASGGMIAVRDRIRDAAPDLKDVLLGYGVVMPTVEFTMTGAEIVPEVLLDRRQYPQMLHLYVSRLAAYWTRTIQQKQVKICRGLTPDEIRRVRQVLRPDFETAVSISSYITGMRSQLLHLTKRQVDVSRRLASNPRTIVRGRAGTGKSVIAIERVRALAAEGRDVLYICFNKFLAVHVKASLPQDKAADRIHVFHAHALYMKLIEECGILDRFNELDDSHPEFFKVHFPELVVEGLCRMIPRQWDVIVLDEAQDLMTQEHLDVLELLLKGGLREGRWHLFYDPRQDIYGAMVQKDVEARLEGIHPAFDDLWENCRNTREVATLASIISGIDLAVLGAPEGEACRTVWYTSEADGLRRVEEVLTDLFARGMKTTDLAILSTRRRENSLLRQTPRLLGRPVVEIGDEAGLAAGGILFSTMHGFKGLERNVVLALDLDGIGKEEWAQLYYAGLSRATTLLICVVPESCREGYHSQELAFGARLPEQFIDAG